MGKYNHFKPKNIVNCNSVTVELPKYIFLHLKVFVIAFDPMSSVRTVGIGTLGVGTVGMGTLGVGTLGVRPLGV